MHHCHDVAKYVSSQLNAALPHSTWTVTTSLPWSGTWGSSCLGWERKGSGTDLEGLEKKIPGQGAAAMKAYSAGYTVLGTLHCKSTY